MVDGVLNRGTNVLVRMCLHSSSNYNAKDGRGRTDTFPGNAISCVSTGVAEGSAAVDGEADAGDEIVFQ